MFPIRLAAFISVLLVWAPICLSDEDEKEPPSVKSARSEIQPYVDWLPSNSQTLVVSQRLYQIPAKRPEDASLDTLSLDSVYLRMHVMHMFEGEAREVLVGKRIELWIEAASRFYFPEFPEEVGYVQTALSDISIVCGVDRGMWIGLHSQGAFL